MGFRRRFVALLRAFSRHFTTFAAFGRPPHLSPGLAAAAEESPREMQHSKVQGRAASGGLPQKNGPAAARPRISCLDSLNSCLYWCSQKPRFPESFLAPIPREMGGFEAFSRAFCGLRRRFVALLRAFSGHFTTFAAFGWPPHLSPGLAAAAEESPRKLQDLGRPLRNPRENDALWSRGTNFSELPGAF